MTAQIYLARAKTYYGYRLYQKTKDAEVLGIVKAGLEETERVGNAMLAYPHKNINGQFEWVKDAMRAMQKGKKIEKALEEAS